MSQSPFAQSITPPQRRSPLGATQRGDSVHLSPEALAMFQQLWSWVVSGYVVIPCDVGGSANAIELTPRFRPDVGGGAWADLLAFSFTAADTSTGAVTIAVLNQDGAALDAVAAYVGASAAGVGDVVAGVPYVGLYCVADDDLSLPARMVLK